MLIDWLKELEHEYPFQLTEASKSYMRATLRNAIKDPKALAKHIYAFCPDVVDQGTQTVDALADDIRENSELYLWWN